LWYRIDIALPYGATLLAYGRAADLSPPHGDETQTEYAKRVGRVPAVVEGGPPE